MKFPLSVILFSIFLFDFNQTSTAQVKLINLLFGLKGNETYSIFEESVGNTECGRDLKIFLNDLELRKPWAMQMFDATGKYPGGLLAGRINILGNFDQCLNVSNEEEARPIIGQYCKVYVKASGRYSTNFFDTLVDPQKMAQSIGINMGNSSLLGWLKISHGLCIPHSCSSKNLMDISKYAERTWKLPIHIEVNDYICRHRNKEIFPSSIDKYIISFFCMYTALLLLSTCYDVITRESARENDDSILVAFSVLRNAKHLFSLPHHMDTHLDALSGIKVSQMLWIIFGHRYLFTALSGITNLVYLREWKHEVYTSILQSASYAVDSFLVMSGLLLSYSFLKHMDGSKIRKLPILQMYLYRILRLSPSLLAMILFYTSVFKYLGDGPDWSQVAGRLTLTCSRTWWATLLFFSNFLDYSYMCVEHSWYLAVDSQLFFLSPLLLTSLIKRPWKTCVACIVICVSSGIYTYVITIRHNFGYHFFEANKEFLLNIYHPTKVRMPPWFIGIIFGFLIHTYGYVKLNKVEKFLAWMLTLLLLWFPVYALYYLNRTHETNESIYSVKVALCNSCTKQIWSIGIGILSFLCSTGNGGIISEFMSLPVFQIMVRYCYSVYLTHVPVMAYFIGTKRHPEYFAPMKVAHQVMGDLPFIFLAATIWILAFESPFRVIGKLLIRRGSTSGQTNHLMDHSPENKKKTKITKVTSIHETNTCEKSTEKRE